MSLNPQLRSMMDSNPQVREMMQNPEFLRMLSSPEAMQVCFSLLTYASAVFMHLALSQKIFASLSYFSVMKFLQPNVCGIFFRSLANDDNAAITFLWE